MAIMRVARSVRAEVRVRGPSFDSAPNSSDLSYPAPCSVCPRRAAWDDDQPRHSDGLERSGLYANSKRAHAGAAPRGLSSTDYVRVHVPIGVDQALPSSFIGADQSLPAAFK